MLAVANSVSLTKAIALFSVPSFEIGWKCVDELTQKFPGEIFTVWETGDDSMLDPFDVYEWKFLNPLTSR